MSAALASEGTSARVSQVGLVLMDLRGGIRAVVGGRSYAESQFNRAIKAKRQPGSAFKTFVYLAALESGMTPDSTVLDLPILGSGWSPRNHGEGYRGAVTLREALAHSMNAAAARLNMSVGPAKTAAVARRLGIRSALRVDGSLALGTSEVTLLELTGAYGVLANGGRALTPHLIQCVRTGSGRVLFARQEDHARTLVTAVHVAAMTDMLGAVVTSGTAKRAALPHHPAAGKTGTSQDFRDAWFVGYTDEYVAGVWVGNDDGSPMNRVMGGNLPARLWHEAVLAAYDNRVPATASLSARADRLAQGSAQPLLPREQIGSEFIERVIGEDSAAGAAPAAHDPSRRPNAGCAPPKTSCASGCRKGYCEPVAQIFDRAPDWPRRVLRRSGAGPSPRGAASSWPHQAAARRRQPASRSGRRGSSRGGGPPRGRRHSRVRAVAPG